MKHETRQRKHTTKVFKALRGQDWLVDRMYQVMQQGKQGLDSFLLELGRLMAETILDLDREECAGPDSHPKTPGEYKWAAQPGSVFVGDQKVPVMRPRLRGPVGEIPLATYGKGEPERHSPVDAPSHRQRPLGPGPHRLPPNPSPRLSS